MNFIFGIIFLSFLKTGIFLKRKAFPERKTFSKIKISIII